MLHFKLVSMLRGLAVLGLALAALGGRPAPAQAAGSVGNGLPGSCDEAGLIQALQGGGLVTFNCGGPATVTFTSPITPTASAIIEGAGVITLSGNLSTRLFNVPAGLSLTLRGLVLDRANSGASDGGAISNLGRLTLEHSTIQRSQTSSSNSGAAIFTSGALTLSDSLLLSNVAGSAGALFANGAGARVTLNNARLLSNTANSGVTGFGGALWAGTLAQVTISDGELSFNQANQGGAIYVSSAGALTLTSASQVLLTGNSAALGGGALFNDRGQVSLERASLVANHSTGSGGGLINQGDLTVRDSLFWHNHGANGGGLYTTRALIKEINTYHVLVDHTTFLSNTADSEGGGLVADGFWPVTIIGSAFEANHALDLGGGLERYDVPMTITHSSFTHNSANSGGGLFVNTSSDPGATPYVSVSDSTFSGNTAATGGAVANQDRVQLYSTTLKDNSSGFYNQVLAGVDGRLRGSVLQNTGDNCQGQAPADDAHNFATDDTCAFATSHQGIVPSPGLGPLTSDPGGLTSFHLPLPGSPLINAGPSNCSPTDQRFALRPAACDIGAVEFGGLLPRLWLALQVR